MSRRRGWMVFAALLLSWSALATGALALRGQPQPTTVTLAIEGMT
jgi:hypothetical protein